MKKALLLFSFTMLLASAFAQDKPPASFGIVGAANLAKFNVEEQNNATALEYEFKTDFAVGFYLNFPLSKRLSFEPQFLFVANKLRPTTTPQGAFSGSMNYFGIPLLLKIHAGKYIAFPIGAQIDFLTNVNDDANLLDRQNFEAFSVGPTAGIEIAPISRVMIFGRYVYGMNTVNLGPDSKPYEFKNQNIYAGIKIKLFDFTKKAEPPPPPPPPVDTDRDGIIDSLDKCPTVPGIAKYDGCPIPDTDKDGINDEEDKCPTVPGIAKYQGCPVPDTDKDGINDEEDKCPTVPGVARYQGCPIPDTDGDGVNDEEDKCPTVPGPRENQGCPVISEEVKKRVDFAANNILFITGSFRLASKSFKGLDEVVKIMTENPEMKLAIDGHTDNVGKDDMNQTLSDNRAASVKAYFVSKGIDESRITSAGHGETMPIADNKTAAGRAKNRRVELKLSY
jgi:outer membrane protein OmpA-like peptidoglycan-associated protein